MHDMQYRAQDCCEQSSYNQPPHPSFYLGSDAKLPARPSVQLNNTAGEYIPPTPVVISGKNIENLIFKDTANKNSWKIAEQPAEIGSTVFGDRAYTYSELPTQLKGAEILETACGSKNTDGQLAEFTAAQKIDTFVLLDTRVETTPKWLNGWTKTALTAKTDNDVTFAVYQRTFDTAETVTLGTNGAAGNVVNYTVFVAPTGNAALIGDVNLDGQVNAADAVALQQYLLTVRMLNTEQAAQADISGDGRLNAIDLTRLKRMLMR